MMAGKALQLSGRPVRSRRPLKIGGRESILGLGRTHNRIRSPR